MNMCLDLLELGYNGFFIAHKIWQGTQKKVERSIGPLETKIVILLAS